MQSPHTPKVRNLPVRIVLRCSLIPLILAVLTAFFTAPAGAVRVPEELQPLSSDSYRYSGRFALAPGAGTRVSVHSTGGLADIEVHRIDGASGDTLLVWEATEIAPREVLAVEPMVGSGLFAREEIRVLSGVHYLGFEVTAGSPGGIYEIIVSVQVDGALVSLPAGGGETSEAIVAVPATTSRSARVDWFGRGLIPDLVGKRSFDGSFALADRFARGRGGWSLVLPDGLSATLPRLLDSGGSSNSYTAAPDDITEAEIRYSPVWLVGAPSENRWLAEALTRMGTRITSDGFAFEDGRTVTGTMLDCVVANPWSPDIPMRLTVAASHDILEEGGRLDAILEASSVPFKDGRNAQAGFRTHHLIVTDGEDITRADEWEEISFPDDVPLYEFRARENARLAFHGTLSSPGNWSSRFALNGGASALTLKNRSERWSLRLEHFFLVWDGDWVEPVPPSSETFEMARMGNKDADAWDTEHELCVTARNGTPEDWAGFAIGAVPYRFVDDDWIRMGDTVWTVASTEPTRCIRFLRNGMNTRWDIIVRNETARAPIYFSETWGEQRHYSIRSAPYFLNRATEAARANWIPIAAMLAILLGASVAFALLHSRNREKATILADIKEELNKARDMQRSLFPSRNLRNDDLEVTGVCHSMQECGGDYYDYFTLRDGSVLFTVADVAGHGYAAALRMSSIHYHLHSGELSVPDPAHILTQLNRNLAAAGRPSEFVTHFLARVSADGRKLWYASAGHPGAVLVRGDGRIETLDSTGLPLGIMPDAEYEQRRVDLGPRDLVVAFTDGLLEATNHRDEEYGEERVIDVLSRYNRKNLDAIISALFESVTGFQGRIAQLDDIAIIAARVASS